MRLSLWQASSGEHLPGERNDAIGTANRVRCGCEAATCIVDPEER
jgi:hypothetical protein